MSEAIEITSSYEYTQLDFARKERLKSTLIFLTKEYRESRARVKELTAEISTIIHDLKSVQSKREKLMKQNFSSSEHLKKTHSKYWTEIQGKARIFQVKRSQLQFYKDKVEILTEKIPEIKSQLLSG